MNFLQFILKELQIMNNDELYKEKFLYTIPECLVTLLIESKNKKYVDFIIEICCHENNFLFNEYKAFLGIYNYNNSSFRELHLELILMKITFHLFQQWIKQILFALIMIMVI